MQTINLYAISQIQDATAFAKYADYCSKNVSKQRVRDYERVSLEALVELMISKNCPDKAYDGFFYNYSIPQIGKEFDLLKITPTLTLNIELKSQPVPNAKVENQLRRNYYYLKALQRKIEQFCFNSSTGDVFTLDDSQHLVSTTVDAMLAAIQNMGEDFHANIDDLFHVSDFLVSPLNTPDAFISDEYFLTSHQEEIKRSIINCSTSKASAHFYSVTGSAGTGKTLLLYDIAKECTRSTQGCLIHCGNLSPGHEKLDRLLPNLAILPAKSVNGTFDFSDFDFIFVDEVQRIYDNTYDLIVQAALTNNSACVFSFDPRQCLSHKERDRNVSERIRASTNIQKYSLTDKIRTNPTLANFIQCLFNLSIPLQTSVQDCVSIIYATDNKAADFFITRYSEKGYVFINYTPSIYRYDLTIDSFDCTNTAHSVIGQEFDNVIMVIDHHFAYSKEGRLSAKLHPNPDYMFKKLLFQGLTRTRQKLCLVVIDNILVFNKILDLVASK